MAADALTLYDVFSQTLGREGHSLNAGDTIKASLLDSGYTPNKVTDVTFSVIDADELATANGYTAGGVTFATTWVTTASVLKFDGTVDLVWNAVGAGITARYLVIYNSSAAGAVNDLIGYLLLDNTPADVTAVAGTSLTLQLSALGLLTMQKKV